MGQTWGKEQYWQGRGSVRFVGCNVDGSVLLVHGALVSFGTLCLPDPSLWRKPTHHF